MFTKFLTVSEKFVFDSAMKFYPLTSIFRTTSGLLPAYRIAPFLSNGEYDLQFPVFILSDEKLFSVSKVVVEKFCNFSILTNPRYWYAVVDGYFYEDLELCSLIGSKPRIDSPKHRVDLKALLRKTFLAGLISAGKSLASARDMISNLTFYEVMSGNLSYDEYKNASRLDIPFDNLTRKHYLAIAYMWLATLFRCRKLVYSKDILKVRATVSNNVWRDFVVTALLHLGFPVEVKYTHNRSFLYFQRDVFALFIREVFSAVPDIPYKDFKMIGKILGPNYIYVDENVQHVSQFIDLSLVHSVEVSQYTVCAATCPGIGFPEVAEYLEINSLIARQKS